ncbi:MAG: hypothetical protein ABSG73_11585 [Candidatus Aminicenantales bacterium]|jgi:hypothetical protein
MKRALLIILGFGIVCSQLLSQELVVRFHFKDHPEQTEAAPEGTAFGSLTGPNQFNMRPNEPGLPRWLSVQSRDDLSIFGDVFRKALISDFGTSEENDPERKLIRTRRLVSGLGLAISWIGTVVVDLLYDDWYRSTTVIPVAGPWITLARLASHHDPGWPGAKALLILSGVAQTSLATYFIISLTRHPKPKETKSVAISASFNTINLRIQF